MVKESLHELIHSMTMPEKRHFKIYASKHVIGGSNDYVQLFDAIAEQVEYNDEFLKRESFVKNLPAEKNYLYRLILRSLNSFHDSSSAKNKIYTLLKNIEILYHKGLYDQALRLVRKAKKLTQENELFIQELVVNELEVELLSKQFKYEEASIKVRGAEETIDELRNFNLLQRVTTDCYNTRLKIGSSRSEEDTERLKKYLNEEGVGLVNYPKTKRAEMYQLGLNLTYSYFIGDESKTLDLTEKMTNLYEQNEFLIEYSTIGYVSSLYNLHNAYIGSSRPDDAGRTLNKLEDCRSKYGIPTSDNIGARVFFYSTNIRLANYLKADNYKTAGALIDGFQRDVERFTPRIGKPQLYEFYFLMSKFYFVTAEFKKALKYSNLVLNDLKFTVRADLLSVVRLLNLLIHFELDNDFTLEYLTKNTLSYLKKSKRLFKVEDELIQFMTNHYKVNTEKERLGDLKQLQLQMRKYKTNQFEGVPFSLFDFEYWATAKLEQRSVFSFQKSS